MSERDDLLDPFVGFVPIHDVRSVFIAALREMDNGVFPEGEHWRSTKLRAIKVLDTAQHELYKRCRRYQRDVEVKAAQDMKTRKDGPSGAEQQASRMAKLDKYRVNP